MMGMIEPMAITEAVGTLAFPVAPGLAMGILILSLILAAVGISLAVAPPSSVLRRIGLSGAAARFRDMSAHA